MNDLALFVEYGHLSGHLALLVGPLDPRLAVLVLLGIRTVQLTLRVAALDLLLAVLPVSPVRAVLAAILVAYGRPFPRYRRRWKVEELFAWLHNYRQLGTRWDYRPEIYLGFVHLGCIAILLRNFPDWF